MLPLVLIFYVSFKSVNVNLTVGGQLQVDLLGAILSVALIVFGLGTFTYFEDLLLSF